jgi:hypothetical protein
MDITQQPGSRGFAERYLSLHPGEWRKVGHFALLGLLFQLGLGLGFSAGDALFLANVGSKGLAVIFILTPFVMLGYTPVFSWIVSRFGMQRACNWTAFSLAVGGAAIFLLIAVAGLRSPFLFYAIKLYLAALYITIYSMYWLYVDEYFSVQEGKRLYPLLSVGCSLGTAGGALIVGTMASVIPVGAFFMIWAAIALITIPVARAVPRYWKTIADLNARTDEDDSENPQNLKAVLSSMMGSRFSKYLAAMLFVTLLITNVAEYQYSAILEKGRSEAQLASVLGTLYGVYHSFNILVCLFAFTPMVKRFGVKNVALMLPAVYFATFILLFLSSSFFAAALAFWAYHSVLTSIEYNNQNLLFNALPARTRRGLRTLIEGLCEPFASCFAGIFLLLVQEPWGLRQIAGVTLLVTALLVAIAFGVRNAYPEALSANMRLGWLNFGASRRLKIDKGDEQSIALLSAEASGDASPQARDALEALIDCSPEAAAPILLRTVADWPDSWSDRAEALLKRFLQRCDEALFAETLLELLRLEERGCEIARRQVAALQLPVIGGDNGDGLANRLAQLRGSLRGKAEGFRYLDALLEGTREERLGALGLIDLLGDGSQVPTVFGFIDDIDPTVRSEALRVLSGIGERGDSKLVSALAERLPLLERRDRRAALDILKRCSTANDVPLMLASSAALDPEQFRRLEAVIVALGASAVPPLVVAAVDGEGAFRARKLAIRALASISLKHLEAWSDGIIDSELQRIKELTRRRDALTGVPAAALLARLYSDRRQESLDVALEVLALTGRLPDVDLISASLKSTSAKVRADALETLNTSLAYPVYRAIVEVLEGERPAAVPSGVAVGGAEIAGLLQGAAASNDPTEAEFACHALRTLDGGGGDGGDESSCAALALILRLLTDGAGSQNLAEVRVTALLRLAALVKPGDVSAETIRATAARLASQEPELAFGLLREAA